MFQYFLYAYFFQRSSYENANMFLPDIKIFSIKYLSALGMLFFHIYCVHIRYVFSYIESLFSFKFHSCALR